MKLYEINEEIQALLDKLVFDEETGEIDDNTVEIMDKLDELNLEKKNILEYVAKVALNERADIEAIKAEEARLKKRRQVKENKVDRIIYILDRECGEKTDLGVATLSYRKSESLAVDDSAEVINWLNANNHEECIKIAAPEIAKTEVKKLIKSGMEIPGASISVKMNVSLR